MMQKLMEINDHLVRTLAECEQLRSDQKTLQEICSIRLQRINELQAELRKACAERDEAVEHAGRLQAERDELREEQSKLQRICADGGRRITELKAELEATKEEADDAPTEPKKPKKPVKTPAGQSDLVRDVSHYIEAAEVDTPVESQPEPQPQPVQVREGRWRTRRGEIRDVIPTPDDDERATKYPWYDAKYDQTWKNNGRYFSDEENQRDLVEYLGPIEPQPKEVPKSQPEPEFKPYTFAAYIVGDRIQPDALRIVWATEEWIQQSKFGIVHRMKDMQFFGNDGGCNITEYHETLTLSLEVQ